MKNQLTRTRLDEIKNDMAENNVRNAYNEEPKDNYNAVCDFKNGFEAATNLIYDRRYADGIRDVIDAINLVYKSSCGEGRFDVLSTLLEGRFADQLKVLRDESKQKEILK